MYTREKKSVWLSQAERNTDLYSGKGKMQRPLAVALRNKNVEEIT